MSVFLKTHYLSTSYVDYSFFFINIIKDELSDYQAGDVGQIDPDMSWVGSESESGFFNIRIHLGDSG